MKKVIIKLKHIFIPHEHNDFKPHFFREASVAVIFGFVLILLFVSASTSIYINKNNMRATVLPAVLVDLTNSVRQSNGEITLTRNINLDKAAQMKANDMANLGYFAHTSPTGVTPWYWFREAGYNFLYAGENLAIDFTESVDVESAWLNSPTHKANLLDSKFTEIGIATSEGYYNGHPTVYVVQMFGKPNSFNFNINKEAEASTLGSENNISENNELKKENTPPVIIPIVKGEAINLNNNDNSHLETITENSKFISVKNLSDIDNTIDQATNSNQKYSTWYQKLLFKTPSYMNLIYKILLLIIVLDLFIMTIIEVKRQHPKNIMYGVLLVVIIFCLIYINKSIFLVGFLG